MFTTTGQRDTTPACAIDHSMSITLVKGLCRWIHMLWCLIVEVVLMKSIVASLEGSNWNIVLTHCVLNLINVKVTLRSKTVWCIQTNRSISYSIVSLSLSEAAVLHILSLGISQVTSHVMCHLCLRLRGALERQVLHAIY